MDTRVIYALALLGLALACGIGRVIWRKWKAAEAKVRQLMRDLQDERVRWQMALDGSDAGLFDWNLVTGDAFFSKGWEQMLGFPPGELPNYKTAWEERLHPEDRERVKTALERYLAREESRYWVEYRMLHRDGSWRWIMGRAVAVWDEDGRAVRVVGSHTDVTEQRETEQLLLFAEARFHAFMTHSPAVSFMKDKDGRYVYLSPNFTRLLGVDPDMAIGKSDAEVWPREIAESIRVNDEKVLGENRAIEMLEIVPTRDGERRWLAFKFPVENLDGEALLGGIAVDITEKYEAEQSQRRSEGKLRALIEAIPDGVACYDKDLRYVYSNAAAARRVGASDVLGRTDRELGLAANLCDGLEPMLRDVLERGTPQEVEFMMPAAGGPRYFQSRAVRQEGESGPQVLVVTRDITAMEETRRALKHARNEAESAAAAKSEFLAAMSHEIRTPMNGVIGMTALLLDTELTDEQQRYAETVKSSAEGLLSILNDILDFSKMESGNLSIERMAFDLRAVADQVAELFSTMATEKGLSLILDYGPKVPDRFVGDPGRIRQVLMNLVGNAIKFTPQGHVLLRFRYANAGPLTVEVEDTGIGIPKNRQHLLFTKFMQADSSTTRKYGGTGLGLAISRQLANLMGGDIECVSEEGKGTTFRVTLPLEVDAETPAQDGATGELQGVRMLVAAPCVIERGVLAEMLGGWGARCEVVGTAEEACRLLADAVNTGDPVRVAVIDEAMVSAQGDRLGCMVRRNETLAGLQIILLTPHPRQEDRAMLAAAGFAGQLAKPVSSRILKRALDVLCHPKSPAEGEPKRLLTSCELTERAPEVRNTGRDVAVGLRVLLAEDNPVNEKVASTILRKAGCVVDTAGNGALALAKRREKEYDVIFMDCQMPEMDGYQATAAIRAWEKGRRRAYIVAMTANALEGDRERCLTAGMDAYMSKPFRAEDLYRLLEGCKGKEMPGGIVAAERLTTQ